MRPRRNTEIPDADENRNAPASILCAGVSPGAQAQPDDRRSGVGDGDHPGAPGGSAPVPAEAGVDIGKAIVCVTSL